MNTPILFLVFNRPEVTARVFHSIRRAQPPRLYIAADGPRADRFDDAERCREVRDLFIDIDCPCEVRTLFRKENLGCRVAVREAIDWFFEHEEQGIILEDDCLPDPTFFRYCEELLGTYRDDDRVMLISGDYFHGESHRPINSYYFSHYNHCWGWASWRRAWRLYDRDMARWPSLRDTDWLARVGNGHPDFERYWRYVFDKSYAGEVDTWDYQWLFSCWVHQGLTALPAYNLIKNIGFDEAATHTAGDTRWKNLALEALKFPLVHPADVVRDVERDRLTDLNVVGTRPTLLARIVSKCKAFFAGMKNGVLLKSNSVI